MSFKCSLIHCLFIFLHLSFFLFFCFFVSCLFLVFFFPFEDLCCSTFLLSALSLYAKLGASQVDLYLKSDKCLVYLDGSESLLSCKHRSLSLQVKKIYPKKSASISGEPCRFPSMGFCCKLQGSFHLRFAALSP